MIRMALNISLMAAGLALVSGTAGAAAVRTVKAIEFKGLKLLSKYDLVRGVRLRAVPRGIVIDVDSLGRALEGNAFLKTYRVDEVQGKLLVTVVEKKPALVVVAERDGATAMYELDGGHEVISKNNVHTNRVPYVHIGSGNISDAAAALKRLFAVLVRVREKNSVIYRELSEIYCNGDSIRVVLRGRKTGFVMKPDVADFIRLKYVTGYCDHAERYPEEIDLSDNTVVVR